MVTIFFKFLQVIVISGYIATLQDELYTLERNHISKVKFLSFEIFFKHCPFLDGLNPIAIKGIAISLQALINISLGFISCSFQVDNGMQIATCYGCLSACYPHNYFYLYKWLIPFDFISFLSKNFIYFFFVFY